MELNSTRIITADVERLVDFYELITGIPATWLNELFAEIHTDACTLAIQSATVIERLSPGAAEPASNRSVTLDFLVDDVDASYAALQDSAIDFVGEPATMPWGNRSLLFRDPDGNLINFFAPVMPEAQARFAR
jgi:catechol 2,3-dioxygenase-like lactoylglutathione lyase family enzyme